jgi:hypothetical protein
MRRHAAGIGLFPSDRAPLTVYDSGRGDSSENGLNLNLMTQPAMGMGCCPHPSGIHAPTM